MGIFQHPVKIAENCDRVPYHPARNFYEAIQSVWFVHTLMHVEGTGPVYTFGRFDQYMYPFYDADIQSGLISKEQAQELIENFYINTNNNLFLYDTQSAYNSAGFTQYQVISLGGIDEWGKDASNELTYLCMDAAKSVRTVQPDLSLLCHPRETPYELKYRATELVQAGLGLPKFHNTETIKTALLQLGYTLQEASVGWVRGCTEPYGPGSKQFGHTAGAFVNIVMAFEAALFNGIKQMPDQKWSGQQIGLATGNAEDFASYEDLLDAVKAQITYVLQEAHVGGSYMEMAQSQFPQLLQSLFTDGCIEKVLPANAGGAKINVGPGLAVCSGWATITDSLAAIKKLVFEEKKITMKQLLEALKADFVGHEALRQLLINDVPKFGNDVDYVDDIARDIFKYVHDESRKLTGIHGNINSIGTDISVSHIIFGSMIGATPDGRNAGQALSDNVAPTSQKDVNGPVAHINSVTKMPLQREFGSIHNIYLTNVDSDEKRHNVINIVDAYHRRGGHHLQINCIDKGVLIDAQNNPDKYPTLMVRVAGYCAYFNDLSKYVQDYIIDRTSHLV
jgi:formate C-acetyltransferase